MILQVVRHKEDTEDLCQDVFVKVYFKLKRFRFESTFKTWLYRIVINSINNKLDILELQHTHHKEIRGILTDEQKIKYVIFDHKFKKKMKDQLLDKRSHRGPGQ